MSLIRAESDENTCRKDFTPAEAVDIGLRVEEAYRPLAEAALMSGKAKDSTPRENFPRVQDESARTRAVAEHATDLDAATGW